MSKIYISPLADKMLTGFLKASGHKLIFTEPVEGVDKAISHHPDIIRCKLGDKVFCGDPEKLTAKYPGDIIYNACSTGKYFIHNLKHTDPLLLETALSAGQTPVNVSQGYAKCSTVVVDENSIITYDKGIEKAANAAGLSVLSVTPGQVKLEGYPTGFIGGASGRVGDSIVFNGNLAAHSDFKEIIDFIEARNLKCIYFDHYPLTDIGSIIEEI